MSRQSHYVLGEDGRTPVATDLMTWASWLETAGPSRVVARTTISPDAYVSTVSLECAICVAREMLRMGGCG